VSKDGSVRCLFSLGRSVTDAKGRVVKVLGGQVDVTAQRALEEQLRQSQKMEAIGSLTAGIAHNFNNMLTVILPTLELTAKLLPPERVSLLREATHAARRAAEMVHQLMTYAGQSDAHERGVHDIGAVIDASVGICTRVFEPHIALEAHHDGPPAAVVCNAVQLEQVLVNLLVNARDAVNDAQRAEGGRVLVRSRIANVLRDDGHVQRCALIEVIDNGTGMSEAVRARVFEPFFTTKAHGRGTGLGLAMSFAIVRDLGGTLSCESSPGVGTTFTILLPVTSEPLSRPKSNAPLTMPAGHRVLIVDDEQAVRMTLQYVLADAGLSVVSAESGKLALELLRTRAAEIDVVLLDRSMPGGPGESFVPAIRELAPHARIIFLSGGTVDGRLAAMVDAVVPKPVTGPALLDAIHQVFEANAVRH
jgi:nitrogen-specific signal transduction histidine kinase